MARLAVIVELTLSWALLGENWAELPIIYLFLLFSVLHFGQNHFGLAWEVRLVAGLESAANVDACPLFVMVDGAVSLPNGVLEAYKAVVDFFGLLGQSAIVGSVADHRYLPTALTQDYIRTDRTFVVGNGFEPLLKRILSFDFFHQLLFVNVGLAFWDLWFEVAHSPIFEDSWGMVHPVLQAAQKFECWELPFCCRFDLFLVISVHVVHRSWNYCAAGCYSKNLALQ